MLHLGEVRQLDANLRADVAWRPLRYCAIAVAEEWSFNHVCVVMVRIVIHAVIILACTQVNLPATSPGAVLDVVDFLFRRQHIPVILSFVLLLVAW